MKSALRLGTRGSALAMYQAELVRSLLLNDFPCMQIEIVKIKTSGDMIRRGGFDPLETKRIFTREIEESLLKEEIDIAVHSAKDTSVCMPEGLHIGAVTMREEANDCLVSRDKKKMVELPLGARIGTSSMRRRRQLLRWNDQLVVEEVRGNVETRVRKMDEGHYDALVLAYAGIKRLGLEHYVAEILPIHRFHPAPAQGSILVQSREKDDETNALLHTIHHEESATRLTCERAFLKRLEGGCQLPCGAHAVIKDNKILAEGSLFAVHERQWAEAVCEGPVSEPGKTGILLAEKVLAAGGQEILEKIQSEFRKKK